READDHFACRPGPPGFDERQMPGRHLGPQREVELGEPAPFPPAAQQPADRRRLSCGWRGNCREVHPGNCSQAKPRTATITCQVMASRLPAYPRRNRPPGATGLIL